MGIFDFLGMGDAAAKPIDAIGNVIGKIYTSDDEKLTHAEIMERINQQPALWQAETNKIDAGSPNWWQNGWRPAYGWVGAISLFFYFVPQYIIASYLWTIMCLEQHKLLEFPLEATSLLEFACIMLGVYGTHVTIEKIKGVRNT